MAQVGRISGPLLFSNLERNGKNLDFRNQAASTPVLKLDVNNSNVGINLTNPAFALDLGTETVRIDEVNLDSLNVPNFLISSDNINVSSGNLNFVNPVTQSENRTQQVRMQGNTIETYVTDANLNILPQGTGTVELLTDTNVDGALHATGNITLDGNITFGDSSTDTFAFNAEISSNIIPDAHYTYNLGTNKKVYNNLWAHRINGIIANTNALTLNNIDVTNIVGNTFYVSTEGDDTNKGDHPQSPWRSIKHALQAADSSSQGPTVIYVASGEYEEEFPLTVPANTSVCGEDMRNTIIKPDSASTAENCFLLTGETTIHGFTIKDFYYDSLNDKGYAFAYAPNAITVSRSPYVYNCTVITKGSVTSASDPRGYDEEDAGRGVLIDGASVDTASPSASFLAYSLTLITPGTTAVKATNGVQVEWLNSFIYFAKEGIKLENGTTGRLTSDGSTINYGAEIRSINSANVYGQKGIVADGDDCLCYIVEHTFSYLGTGKRSDNDASIVTKKYETEELNNGKIVGTWLDKNGNFNVGDTMFVNVETGDVEFKSVDFDFDGLTSFTVNTGGSVVIIDSTKVTTDFIRFRSNTVESTAGEFNIDAPNGVINANGNVNITGDLDVTGDVTIGGQLVRLGNENTDNVTFNADVNNTLEPNLAGAFNLGSTSNFWRWLYSTVLDTDEVRLETNKISTKSSDADLELQASGTGNIVLANLRASNNITVSGNTTVERFNQNDTLSLTADLTISGASNLHRVTAETISSGTNVLLDLPGIAFLGNRIVTKDTNANLELVAAGTGNVKVINDLQVDNDLFAPNADYSASDITSNTVTANNLIVNNNLTINGISINESFAISGNVIETISTNANAELRANGTGKVVLQDNAQFDENLTVDGNTTLSTVTITDTTTDRITTDSINVPRMDFDNVDIAGNVIRTTISNSDLEFSASGTGDVIIKDNFNVSNDVTVENDTSLQSTTATTSTVDNLTVNTNITMPSNMQLEGIDFLGNAITSNATNSDLDLRASGTGNVILENDTVISNGLTVNGTATFTEINNTDLAPGNLTTETISAPGVQFEDIAIFGNKVETTLTNSNLQLGASGTGNVLFNGQVDLQNITINGNLTVQGVNVNNSVDFDEFDTSGNIEVQDNYITTTLSNSDLELRTSGAGTINLNDVTIAGDVLDTTALDRTLDIAADKIVVDSTDSIMLPRGTVDLTADSTLSSHVRYDTSIKKFVGKTGTTQAAFAGIYSSNLQTRVRIDDDTNATFFDINGTSVLEMNAINETYADRIELDQIVLDNNVIQTTNTNGNLLLSAYAGNSKVIIDDLEFLGNTIRPTGDNIGYISMTDDGYAKFNIETGLRIPIGDDSNREQNPEVGHIRYNTDQNYLEIYASTDDGWITSAGANQGILEEEMEEIMNEYILIFG